MITLLQELAGGLLVVAFAAALVGCYAVWKHQQPQPTKNRGGGGLSKQAKWKIDSTNQPSFNQIDEHYVLDDLEGGPTHSLIGENLYRPPPLFYRDDYYNNTTYRRRTNSQHDVLLRPPPPPPMAPGVSITKSALDNEEAPPTTNSSLMCDSGVPTPPQLYRQISPYQLAPSSLQNQGSPPRQSLAGSPHRRKSSLVNREGGSITDIQAQQNQQQLMQPPLVRSPSRFFPKEGLGTPPPMPSSPPPGGVTQGNFLQPLPTPVPQVQPQVQVQHPESPPPGGVVNANAVTIKHGLKCSSPLFNRKRMLTSSTADVTTGGKSEEEGSVMWQGAAANHSKGDTMHAADESWERSESTEKDTLLSPSPSAAMPAFEIPYSELVLGKMIGGGGFGQVYRATWRGTPVAVKVLIQAAQVDMDSEMVEEFCSEVEMLSVLRHPNICLFMGACLRPPNRAIVTELVSRGSLWEALREKELPKDTGGNRGFRSPPDCWPWGVILKVAEGVACGMNYLHKGGGGQSTPVLHRDLKSANLLLDDSFTVKICDFGLARLKAFTNSMTGNCGTVQWMAPEVLQSEKYSEPADVYSFGIVFWELLSRRCPYEGLSQIQVALAVLNSGTRPDVPYWCPPCFANLMTACWAPDPSSRPSFAEILASLRDDTTYTHVYS